MTQGLMEKVAVRCRRVNRTRKACRVADFMQRHRVGSALIVGCGVFDPHRSLVEAAVIDRVPHAVATDSYFDRAAGPWRYLRADSLALPFPDGAFDLVISNAVIEHVGDQTAQRRFAAEHARVGRTWVITTPNRWFPLESHTNALLRHWSPRWRASRQEFTRLLSLAEFGAVLPKGASVRGGSVSPTFIGASHPI